MVKSKMESFKVAVKKGKRKATAAKERFEDKKKRLNRIQIVNKRKRDRMVSLKARSSLASATSYTASIESSLVYSDSDGSHTSRTSSISGSTRLPHGSRPSQGSSSGSKQTSLGSRTSHGRSRTTDGSRTSNASRSSRMLRTTSIGSESCTTMIGNMPIHRRKEYYTSSSEGSMDTRSYYSKPRRYSSDSKDNVRLREKLSAVDDRKSVLNKISGMLPRRSWSIRQSLRNMGVSTIRKMSLSVLGERFLVLKGKEANRSSRPKSRDNNRSSLASISNYSLRRLSSVFTNRSWSVRRSVYGAGSTMVGTAGSAFGLMHRGARTSIDIAMGTLSTSRSVLTVVSNSVFGVYNFVRDVSGDYKQGGLYWVARRLIRIPFNALNNRLSYEEPQPTRRQSSRYY